MSPAQFKKIRSALQMNQREMAELLGVSSEMVIGHYETGFRNPGKLIQVVMSILGSLSETKRKDFIALLKTHSKKVESPGRRSGNGKI